MTYFFGIVLVIVGVLLVIKAEWFYQNFGTINWAEEHMGTAGGSRLMYKIIGLILILIGFLLITNLFGGFVMGTIGRLFVR